MITTSDAFHHVWLKPVLTTSLLILSMGTCREIAAQEQDPTRGDNLKRTAQVSGINVSLSDSPVQEVRLESADGVDLSFALRYPKGTRPLPAVLFLHGGGKQASLKEMRRNLINGPVQTRFLEKRFIVVQCSRRPFWKSGNYTGPSGFYDAVQDTLLIVEKVKSLPNVDKGKVVLYGGSGGGILAIVTASRTSLACVISGEPATVVPLAPNAGDRRGTAAYRSIMTEPSLAYIGRRKQEVCAWIEKIDCPILILQGNPEGLYKTNSEILIPEVKRFGKDISSITYPDVTHGFYWGRTRAGATKALVDQIVRDALDFIQKHSQQSPGGDSLKAAPQE